MKKIGQSKIINLVVSFLIALLMFAYVTSTKTSVSGTSSANSFSTLIPEQKATLKAPLSIQMDNDRYVAIGVPSSVKVTVEGSGALISAAKSRNDIQASVDLRGLKPGKHTVTIALKGVNASLTSTVNPQKITVTIAKRATAKVPVEVKYDQTKIAKGYTVGTVSVDPKHVVISGPKTNVDSVDRVVAQVNLTNGVKDSLTQSATLVALDKNGNTVEVNFSQHTANVALTVSPEDSKKLTLSANTKNGDSSQYDVSFSPKTVTAYGSSDILNSMSSLSISVDLEKLAGKGETNIDLPTVDGIVRYDSTTVSVKVTRHSDSSQSSSSSSDDSSSSTSNSSSSN